MPLNLSHLRSLLTNLNVQNRPVGVAVPQRYTDQDIDALLAGVNSGPSVLGAAKHVFILPTDDSPLAVPVAAGESVFAVFIMSFDVSSFAFPGYNLSMTTDTNPANGKALFECYNPSTDSWTRKLLDFGQEFNSSVGDSTTFVKVTVSTGSASSDGSISFSFDNSDYNSSARAILLKGSSVIYYKQPIS